MKPDTHSHPSPSVLTRSRATVTLVRPAPLYKRGRAGECHCPEPRPPEESNRPTLAQLERLALQAHARGDTWREFWPSVSNAVAHLAGANRRRFHTVYGLLFGLVVCGDLDGGEPIGSSPWEQDDAPPVPVLGDTITAARCLWSPGQDAGSAGQ